MLFDDIKVGDRIEINIIKSIHKQDFVSQVERITKTNELIVYAPVSHGHIVKLPLNETCNFIFFTDKGKISFETHILNYVKDKKLVFMIVKLLDKGKRIQMREFYRHPCLLPLKFMILENDITNEDLDLENSILNRAMKNGVINNKSLLDAIVKDISGGGLKFVCNIDIELQTNIRCLLKLGTDNLVTTATVVFKQHFPNSNYEHQYHAKFTNISREDQDVIVRFIFTEQRRELMKTR